MTLFRALPLAFVVLCGGTACAQTPQDEPASLPTSRPGLYDCDGCEVASEPSPDTLDWRVTLPPEGEPGEPLILSGRVFQPDGVTPAPGVVLYFHQTNAAGLYRSILSTARGGRRDGMIEGWLVTDADGRYEVTTIRPAPYPNAALPAHVHVYVKEPARRPYYLDDFVFEDDPYVTSAYRARQELRGGSGILTLRGTPDEGWRGQRDLVLEP